MLMSTVEFYPRNLVIHALHPEMLIFTEDSKEEELHMLMSGPKSYSLKQALP